MSKHDTSLIKNAIDYIYSFFDKNSDPFIFHSYAFVSENISAFKEIAKAEELDKDEYDMAILAIAFKDLGLTEGNDKKFDNQALINQFFEQYPVEPQQLESFNYYIGFLRSSNIPRDKIEQVLRDAADIHLAFPDALERISLMRIERENLLGKVYDELQWIEICKKYFITHNFFTRYAKKIYGTQRGKNFFELERRIDRIKLDQAKQQNKTVLKDDSKDPLTYKETEDLFKIAFRNYVDLVSVADRKAGLLIQVNSIIASVVIAFAIRHIETKPLFGLPTGCILLVSLATILYAIMASKPQEQVQRTTGFDSKDAFFFGSFDRIDNEFINIPWEVYKKGTQNILNGNKSEVYLQITQETFMVRKVLAKKFRYISIAYKIFMFGLVASIVCFLIVFFIYE